MWIVMIIVAICYQSVLIWYMYYFFNMEFDFVWGLFIPFRIFCFNVSWKANFYDYHIYWYSLCSYNVYYKKGNQETLWNATYTYHKFVIWFWRYLTKGLIWHLSQSSIKTSIYFSLIVKSSWNPFLEPTSSKQ